MHLNRVGKNLKPTKRYKIKRYLTTKMNLYVTLLAKYGSKAVADF